MPKNPLDDYLTTKQAGIGDLLGSVGKNTVSNFRTGAEEALGSGAVGLAATGMGVAALKIYRAIGKRKEFKSMLEHNPDLAEHQQQDPAKFNAHYNSLRAMVPAYAQDPIISGSIMRSMSLNPETAGSYLIQNMESQSKTGPSLSADMGPLKIQHKF